jgi:hypothetical protein
MKLILHHLGRVRELLRLRPTRHPVWPQPAGMRIAYVMNRFPNLTETFVYHEVEAIRRRGFDVVTVSIRQPKR